jgi:hypothetical protein
LFQEKRLSFHVANPGNAPREASPSGLW